MFVGRQPVPATQPSLRTPCALCVCALSSSGSFDFKLSALNCSPLSPFPTTLTTRPQIIEKTATLSLLVATLTRCVKHNPFVCHSYKKHRGWGTPLRLSSQLPICLPFASTNPFRIKSFADPHPLSPMESNLSKKHGGGEGRAANRQFDFAVRPAKTANGRLAAAGSFLGSPPLGGAAMSPAFAPEVPISISRRTALIGASSFSTTAPPLASMPRFFHITSRSTGTGLSFHSAYNFCKSRRPQSCRQSSALFPKPNPH